MGLPRAVAKRVLLSRGVEGGELLSYLEEKTDAELAAWEAEDTWDESVIFGYIKGKHDRERAPPPAGSNNAAYRASFLMPDPIVAKPEVLQGLKRVAEHLLTVDINGDYIAMPNGLPVQLPSPLKTSIYIRKDYRKVLKCMRIEQGGLKTDIVQDTVPQGGTVDSSISTASSTSTHVAQAPRISPEVFIGNVLSGPPGVGKSSIVLLVIAALAHAKKVVVYRFASPRTGEVYVLMDFSKSPVEVDMEYTSRPVRLAGYIHLSETWFLWDGPPNEGNSAAQFNGDGPSFYMSSPNDANFHNFIKGKGAALLYLNAFSFREFLKVAEMHRMSVSEAADRYSIFGGSIRLAIEKRDTENKDTLRKSVSGDDALQLLNIDLLGHRSKISHTLAFMVSGDDLQAKYLTLASPYVRQVVFEKGFLTNLREMERLVVAGVGKSAVAGFAGHMFEQYGHHVMPIGGLRVHMRKLEPPEEPTESVNPPGRERLSRAAKRPRNAAEGSDEDEGDDNDEVDEDSKDEDGSLMEEEEEVSHHLREGTTHSAAVPNAAQITLHLEQMGLAEGNVLLNKVERVWDSPDKDLSQLSSCYVQPTTANNASWDSYYRHENDRYAVNFTVSDSHGIKQQPIQKLCRRLKVKPGDVKMVFGVPAYPPELYDNFRWQPWEGVRGQKLQRRNWLPMEQWVMKLPIVAQPQSSSGSSSRSTSTDGAAGAPTT